MQATVAAWLMATLTPSALMVALVQTASTAPALLFGLLAGSLADIVDRRKIILATQIVLLVATCSLGLRHARRIDRPGEPACADLRDRRGVHVLHAGAAGEHQRFRRRARSCRGRSRWARRRSTSRARSGRRSPARSPPGSAPAARCSPAALLFVPMIVAVRVVAPARARAAGRAGEADLRRASAALRYARHSRAVARVDLSQPSRSASARARSGRCCP